MKKALLLIVLTASFAMAHDAMNLRFIGEQQIQTGAPFEGTEIGGLSGIDFDAATGNYWAISDDRSSKNPARFYQIALDFNTETFNGGEFLGVTTLLTPEGDAFATGSVDPESIRVVGERLFWSSEGQNNANGTLDPFVWEIKPDGSVVRPFNVPNRYKPIANVPVGVRNNLAFESLSINGDQLFTATEGPLLQDGESSSLTHAGLIRVTEYELESGNAAAEYAYVVDPMPFAPEPADAFSTVGVTEMLALGEGKFLFLERSYAAGVGNGARLYMADNSRASNILDVASLRGADIIPMQKQLVFDFASLGIPLDNLEAMTFGPELDNGNRSFIVASDNNFSDTQFTQFLVFEVTE